MIPSRDSDLLEMSLRGDREAYGVLVERYQSLICALAYNGCGDLARSEDIAQETFLTAWQQLPQLREPNHFKAWLCGIARNLMHNALRKDRRELVSSAEPLDSAGEAKQAEATPEEQAITKEEEQILWRTLEQIPETYREPLILFYREQQSVQSVARALDLTEDAVKQRLSRGRQMLKEQVAEFVESALRTTRPQRAFTLAVLAALPAASSAAATVSVAAMAASAKTASLLKPTALFGFTGAGLGSVFGWIEGFIGAFVGVLGGFLGVYIPRRIALATAKSDQERNFIEKWSRGFYWLLFGFVGLTLVLSLLMGKAPDRQWRLILTLANASSILVFVLLCSILSMIYSRRLRAIRLEHGGRLQSMEQMPEMFQKAAIGRGSGFKGYESKLRWFGLPLIHVASGRQENGVWKRGVARGWIAVGDIAFGIVFAAGGFACGGISFGGLGVGIISFGGVALGLLSFGGLAFGGWALGGLAMGWMAMGGAAVAWHAAEGGLAIAKLFAQGGEAVAAHANDAMAKSYFASEPFFKIARGLMSQARWLTLLAMIPLVLSIGILRKLAACERKQESSKT
ncbi:MAG: sigma-70 family RNA polymerase sigma factor [Verrucomicrobiota bacterium]